MTRFAPALSIVATLLFATACNAGGSAEGIPEKFEIAWRLEKDGADLSKGTTTCELRKRSPCEFWIDEPTMDFVPLNPEPLRPSKHTYGYFFISPAADHIRQRNPQWPKGMVAVRETGDRAFNRFYAVLKEPSVMDAKTATKGEWDPMGRTYMPWSRFAKGFDFELPLVSIPAKGDPILGHEKRIVGYKNNPQRRGTGRVVITVAVGK